MAIIVQCGGCQREYRVRDEAAGQRVRCKECGTEFVVPGAAAEPESFPLAPPPLPPVAPPPLPFPAIPVYQNQPPQFQSSYPPRPASASSGSRMTIAIVIGVVLLVVGAGGIMAYIERTGVAFPWSSDASLHPRVVGTWSITRAANGKNITGYIAFYSDGTFRTEIHTGALLAKFSGTWQLSDRLITLSVTAVQHGKKSVLLGQRIPYGRVKSATSTTLILATKYGDETYVKSPNGQRFP